MTDDKLDDEVKLRKFELEDDTSSEPTRVFTNVDLNDAKNADLLVFIQKLQHGLKSGKSFDEIDAELRKLEEDSSV